MLLFGLVSDLDDKDAVKMFGIFVNGVVSIATAIIAGWVAIKLRTVISNVADLQHSQTANAIQVKADLDNNNKIAIQKADQKAAEVKQTVIQTTADQNEKLDAIAKQGEIIHTIVNGKMSIQLKVNAELARKIADLTHDPKDIAFAEMAEKTYKTYMATQSQVEASLHT